MSVQTRSTLNSNAASNINDNTTGQVTPAKVRGVIADIIDSMAMKDVLVSPTWSSGITVTLADTPQFVEVSIAANGTITLAGLAAGREAFILVRPDATPRTIGFASVYPGSASYAAAPTVANTPRLAHVRAFGTAYTDVILTWCDIA